MSGYRDMLRIQRIEKEANLLGFRLGNPKNGDYHREWGDLVSAYPKDDCFPMYSRDAELFCGTFSQLENFLMGWEKAQQYDMLLRLSDEKKRKIAEEKTRERHRLEALKIEQKRVWDILDTKEQ